MIEPVCRWCSAGVTCGQPAAYEARRVESPPGSGWGLCETHRPVAEAHWAAHGPPLRAMPLAAAPLETLPARVTDRMVWEPAASTGPLAGPAPSADSPCRPLWRPEAGTYTTEDFFAVLAGLTDPEITGDQREAEFVRRLDAPRLASLRVRERAWPECRHGKRVPKVRMDASARRYVPAWVCPKEA